MEKKTKDSNLAKTSSTLSIISVLVIIAYFIAAFLALANGALIIFAYAAAAVAFLVSILGAGLAVVDLRANLENKLSKRSLYINLVVLVLVVILFLVKIINLYFL